MTQLDEDGQPITTAFNAARLSDRKTDELIGMCRGVLADGAIAQSEAEYMQKWILSNQEISNHWPANILFTRLQAALEDGKLDGEEERDLLETLAGITGEPNSQSSFISNPTTLPLCYPAPEIEFLEIGFCFTGKFATGTRKKVERMISGLGGIAKSSPSKKVRYMVIGSVGSTDWIHSTHGRKIEKAVKLRTSGIPLHIISEEHWYGSISVDVSL